MDCERQRKRHASVEIGGNYQEHSHRAPSAWPFFGGTISAAGHAFVTIVVCITMYHKSKRHDRGHATVA
jgi:hypothetical protein